MVRSRAAFFLAVSTSMSSAACAPFHGADDGASGSATTASDAGSDARAPALDGAAQDEDAGAEAGAKDAGGTSGPLTLVDCAKRLTDFRCNDFATDPVANGYALGQPSGTAFMVANDTGASVKVMGGALVATSNANTQSASVVATAFAAQSQWTLDVRINVSLDPSAEIEIMRIECGGMHLNVRATSGGVRLLLNDANPSSLTADMSTPQTVHIHYDGTSAVLSVANSTASQKQSGLAMTSFVVGARYPSSGTGIANVDFVVMQSL